MVLTPGDAAERAARTAGCLSVACGNCHARPGEPCNVLAAPSLPVVLLDRETEACAHLPRLARAVRLGGIARDDLAAQFGGTLPAGVEL